MDKQITEVQGYHRTGPRFNWVGGILHRANQMNFLLMNIDLLARLPCLAKHTWLTGFDPRSSTTLCCHSMPGVAVDPRVYLLDTYTQWWFTDRRWSQEGDHPVIDRGLTVKTIMFMPYLQCTLGSSPDTMVEFTLGREVGSLFIQLNSKHWGGGNNMTERDAFVCLFTYIMQYGSCLCEVTN